MRHMILLSSSYSTFERIGYHIAFDENFEANYNLFKEKAKEIGATYQYSPYVYTADDWMDEIRTNLFYENVRMISDLDEFISLIEKGLKINALNVAYYILANQKCTHLKLQKLVYLSYQEYLKSTGKKMFSDAIYAFPYGPVIKSVFDRFKNTSNPLECDNVINETYKRMVKFTRIAFANDGFDMLKSIDYILEKYKDYTASELVSLTHRPDSAWSKCYVEGQKNTIIPDDVIVKCLY